MSEHGRFAFEPVFSIVSGRPAALEVQRCQARDQPGLDERGAVWGARRLAEFDAGVAIAAVLHDTGYDATVPLHVDVLADTVVHARDRVRALRAALRRRAGAHPAPPLLLDVNPALCAAPAAALLAVLRELRADGYGIGLDAAGRGFGLDLISTLEPDLVKLEPELVAALPTRPRARAIVRAICELCREMGVRVAAAGVRSRDELLAARDHGVTLAQGPLLGFARRRPSTARIALPPDLAAELARPAVPAPGPRRSVRPRPPRPVTVGDLTHAAVGLPCDAVADAARQAFADHPEAGTVVLLDASRRPTGVLDRNRFMLTISGPYGRALYAYRPARELAERPRTVPVVADLAAATRECLAGDATRSLDDLVVLDADGRCAGVVRVADLLRGTTGAATAA